MKEIWILSSRQLLAQAKGMKAHSVHNLILPPSHQETNRQSHSHVLLIFHFSLKLLPNLVIVLLRNEGHGSQGFGSWRGTVIRSPTQIKGIRGRRGFTSFWWCPAALKGGAACSSQIGAPPWTICSRSHTRLMNAHSVHVTTKQPCKQSANKLSLFKKKEVYRITPKNTSS